MILENLATIGTLVILEGLLSADNALVLAVLVKHLPPRQQKRALRYGLLGAFFFRFVCILAATYLIHVWYFKAVGAGYLFFIAAKHFIFPTTHDPNAKEVKTLNFWKTVALVELTDIIFAVDSIIAAVAISPKLWVVYTGGVLGMVAMRFVAGFFLKLIGRFPGLEDGAYVLVGWIAIKLALLTCQEEIVGFPHLMTPWLFWGGMGVILLSAFVWNKRQ